MKNEELEVNNKLPMGWVYAFPEEIGSVFTGRTPSKSNNEFYGNKFPLYKPTDLNGDNYNLKIASDYLSNKGLKDSRFIPKNSILVTCIASIGKIGFSRLNGSCNQQINAIVPCKKYIYPEYIYFYALSEEYQEILKSSASATTVAILNKSKFNKIPIKLSPLNEQKRIVAKIEKLFSNLDNSDKYLLHLEKQLKRYRQSVLKNSFDTSWDKKTLFSVTNKITDGEHFKPKTEEKGVYFLSAKDIKHNGVDLTNPLYISEELAEKALKRCNPEKNDILIVSRGASVGRMCIVDIEELFCLLGSVILIKPNKNSIDSKYLTYYLKSPEINRILVNSSGSTAQQAIYLRDIQKIEILVPSLKKQKEVVLEIEKHFSIIDKLEAVVQQSIKESKRLRQSILKQAFEGKLVEQDPNDESASVLLEKIAKAKEEYQKAQKKQVRKK